MFYIKPAAISVISHSSLMTKCFKTSSCIKTINNNIFVKCRNISVARSPYLSIHVSQKSRCTMLINKHKTTYQNIYVPSSVIANTSRQDSQQRRTASYIYNTKLLPLVGDLFCKTHPLSVLQFRIHPLSTDTFDIEGEFDKEMVHKALRIFMDLWEETKAVKLLKASVERGIIPDEEVVLNLLQQLANLGEVECLLSLHTFLVEENKICTDTKFFTCLQEGYLSSGRIEEGVSVLRILYHRTRKYDVVDIYFTLITVMILQHFPDKICLVEEFVGHCYKMEDIKPTAGLWKCFMITEYFEQADKVLASHPCISNFIPRMVDDILDCKLNISFPRMPVLDKLFHLDIIDRDRKATICMELVQNLCEYRKWKCALNVLEEADKQELTLSQEMKQLLLEDLLMQEHRDEDGLSQFMSYMLK